MTEEGTYRYLLEEETLATVNTHFENGVLRKGSLLQFRIPELEELILFFKTKRTYTDNHIKRPEVPPCRQPTIQYRTQAMKYIAQWGQLNLSAVLISIPLLEIIADYCESVRETGQKNPPSKDKVRQEFENMKLLADARILERGSLPKGKFCVRLEGLKERVDEETQAFLSGFLKDPFTPDSYPALGRTIREYLQREGPD